MDLKALINKVGGGEKLEREDIENLKFPMRGEGGKFIGKDAFLGLSKEEQEDLLEKVEPVEQVRGPGGKFVSKEEKEKSKAKKEEKKEDKSEKETSKSEEKSKIKTVKVNNQDVRKFEFEGTTYYCVEDILAASEIESPKKYLENLADNNSEVKPLIESLAEAEIKRKGKNETVTFATKAQLFALQKSMQEKLSGEVLGFLHQ